MPPFKTWFRTRLILSLSANSNPILRPWSFNHCPISVLVQITLCKDELFTKHFITTKNHVKGQCNSITDKKKKNFLEETPITDVIIKYTIQRLHGWWLLSINQQQLQSRQWLAETSIFSQGPSWEKQCKLLKVFFLLNLVIDNFFNLLMMSTSSCNLRSCYNHQTL